MNFYEMLNKLESISGSIAKEEYLIHILLHVKNAEAYFRFTFNDKIYGVKEQTFMNAFDNPKFKDAHISDWFEHQHLRGDDVITTITPTTVLNLVAYGNKLLSLSGNDLIIDLRVFFEELSMIKRKWFCRAILKDLRAGLGVKTVNKCFKHLGLKPIKVFALQLCNKIDVYDEDTFKKKIPLPCSMECKYDGIRIQAEVYTNIRDGIIKVILTSRRGKDKTDDYPEIVNALRETFAGENIILDGEVISRSFQELTRKDSDAKKRYVIFDILNDEKLPYKDRYDNLREICGNYSIAELNKEKLYNNYNKTLYTAEHYNCNTIKEAQEYYEHLNEREEEGIIIKIDNAIYERGSRKYMFKCKKVYTADLLCIGHKLGTGKRANMVSTLCLQDKSKTINVDVGSGIDDYTSTQLTGFVKQGSILIGKIVEIKYNEITETGSIRFPRFVCFRDDKDEADDLSNTKVRQNTSKEELK